MIVRCIDPVLPTDGSMCTGPDNDLVFYRSMEMSSRGARRQRRFSVGDTVLLRNPDPAAPPYIAQLEMVLQHRLTQHVYCQLRWFYRPEDTPLGARSHPSTASPRPAMGLPRDFELGDAEVFESTHRDINRAEAMLDKCTILTLAQYARLAKAVKRDELSERPAPMTLANTFFCRRGYNPLRSRFVVLHPNESRFAEYPK